jgi:hypothetical protein
MKLRSYSKTGNLKGELRVVSKFGRYNNSLDQYREPIFHKNKMMHFSEILHK